MQFSEASLRQPKGSPGHSMSICWHVSLFGPSLAGHLTGRLLSSDALILACTHLVCYHPALNLISGELLYMGRPVDVRILHFRHDWNFPAALRFLGGCLDLWPSLTLLLPCSGSKLDDAESCQANSDHRYTTTNAYANYGPRSHRSSHRRS